MFLPSSIFELQWRVSSSTSRLATDRWVRPRRQYAGLCCVLMNNCHMIFCSNPNTDASVPCTGVFVYRQPSCDVLQKKENEASWYWWWWELGTRLNWYGICTICYESDKAGTDFDLPVHEDELFRTIALIVYLLTLTGDPSFILPIEVCYSSLIHDSYPVSKELHTWKKPSG